MTPPAWAALVVALLATPAAAELAFEVCGGAEQQVSSCLQDRQIECATLPVPIDRSGQVTGNVDLRIHRVGPASTLPVLIALAGGPGQSATNLTALFACVFQSVLDRYQLVVFDQRGTGRSGALDCSRLTNADDLRTCASGLGAAAQFYTTADSALDIDDVRAALGVEQITLAGVSYGTHVALEYTRAFPQRVSAIIIDSILPPEGVEPFDRDTYRAVPRVLGELCSDAACRSVTRDVVADTTSLVKRLARGVRGTVLGPDASRARRVIHGAALEGLLVAGDFSPALRAFYPGAMAAALRHDPGPLLRLAVLSESAELIPRGAVVDPMQFSRALQYATACSDIAFPWLTSDTETVRTDKAVAALRAIPAADIAPFDQPTLHEVGYVWPCISWPYSNLPRARSTDPVADVPALLIDGTQDLRTPSENAARVAALLPRASRVTVPFQGHSVLTAKSCAREAARRFLAAEPVGDPCAGTTRVYEIQPRPPATVAQLRPAAVRGDRGRVISGIFDTLRDAFFAAIAAGRSSVALGGLRGGSAHGDIGRTGIHLTLARYVYVRGVVVSGDMVSDADGFRADVSVSGRARGMLHIGDDGSIDGAIGGRRIHLVSQSARALSAGRAFEPEALPPIP